MIRSLALVCLAVSLCASFGFAQTGVVTARTVSGSAAAPAITGTWTTSTTQYNSPGVTGAPYSAEQVQERVQTLADGTHITQTGPSQKMWRDSQGRTRTERSMGSPMNPNGVQYPIIVQIRDPVVGCEYILDTQAKVAHRIELQPMPGRSATARATSVPLPAAGSAAGVLGGVIGNIGSGGAMSGQIQQGTGAPPAAAVGTRSTTVLALPRQSAATVDPTRPQTTNEQLGTQVVEGVLAQGTRVSRVYPVGSQGNDRPITVISESWYSPDLRTMILTKTSDPRSGENTMKLTNISRIEPDALLFMPPADYRIVEETGPQVTIHYTTPRQ